MAIVELLLNVPGPVGLAGSAIDLAALLAVGMANPPSRLSAACTGVVDVEHGPVDALTCNLARAALNPYRLPLVSDPRPSLRLATRKPPVVIVVVVDGAAVTSMGSSVIPETFRMTWRGGAEPDPSELG